MKYQYKSIFDLIDTATLQDWTLTDGVIKSADIYNEMERYGEKLFFCREGKNIDSEFFDKWNSFKKNPDYDRLYSAMIVEYKPLENYSMVEEGTDKRATSSSLSAESTESGTDTGTIKNAGTNTRTDDLTTQLTRSGTTKVEGNATNTGTDSTTIITTNTGTVGTENSGTDITGVSAFDTNDFANRDKVTRSGTGTRTDNTTQEEKHAGGLTEINSHAETNTLDTTDTTTQGGSVESKDDFTTTRDLASSKKGSESSTSSGSDNLDHKLTRSGNIGVTTSQQMLESEIKLRLTNNFLRYVVDGFMSEYTIWGDDVDG